MVPRSVLTSGVRERDLAENGIVWLGRSPFNNTYGFVSSPELTESNGGGFDLTTMMDYVAANPDTIVCMESEFPSRPDGLILTLLRMLLQGLCSVRLQDRLLLLL